MFLSLCGGRRSYWGRTPHFDQLRISLAPSIWCTKKHLWREERPTCFLKVTSWERFVLPIYSLVSGHPQGHCHPGTIPLKKTDCASPWAVHGSSVRGGTHELLPTPLTGLILCSFCMDDHSCCEWSAVVLSCPETLLHWFPRPLALIILLSSLLFLGGHKLYVSCLEDFRNLYWVMLACFLKHCIHLLSSQQCTSALVSTSLLITASRL